MQERPKVSRLATGSVCDLPIRTMETDKKKKEQLSFHLKHLSTYRHLVTRPTPQVKAVSYVNTALIAPLLLDQSLPC